MVQRMDIDEILKDLEDFVVNASRVPLTGKVLMDGDMILDCIDRIRAIMPEEIKQAKQVLDQSDKLLESVEMQGKRILEEARGQASLLVADSEIVKDAQLQKQAYLADAARAAQDLRNDSVKYSEDILQQLELNLERALITIRKSRDDLKSYRA